MDTSALNMNDTKHNASMMSDRKERRSRQNNSMFRTADMKDNRMYAKRKSSVPGHQSSRNFVTTQESTLYSVDKSMESPRAGAKMQTPMTTNVNRSTGRNSTLQNSPRGEGQNW